MCAQAGGALQLQVKPTPNELKENSLTNLKSPRVASGSPAPHSQALFPSGAFAAEGVSLTAAHHTVPGEKASLSAHASG